ncbi:MAG: xanthine dehydrogenase family protein molybdopterin-binding subunit, partial [Alphaproteobacteria bacterium]
RSMRLSGAVMVWSSEQIIEKGKKIAAHVLEAAVDDIDFKEGTFSVKGTDRSIGIFDIARKANSDEVPEDLRGPLKGQHHLDRRLPAYPSGAAICEVEIDPETGKVQIDRYSTVDDVGQVINPLVVHGQVHGGIVQGAGQIIGENAIYEEGTGQLLAGSFLDYQMPRADEYPSFKVEAHEVMSPSNPLGVKGAGEGGTVPALATVTNAVVDALSRYGVKHVEMPVTPERIWRIINGAKTA